MKWSTGKSNLGTPEMIHSLFRASLFSTIFFNPDTADLNRSFLYPAIILPPPALWFYLTFIAVFSNISR